MNTLLFVALVSRAPSDGYRADIVDLPGCAAEGRDISELLVNARGGVLNALQALADAGDDWPKATPFEDVTAPAGAIAMLIDVPFDDPPLRVNISLGERLLQRLDSAAQARGMTRSGFIAQSVRVSLGEQSPGGADFDAAGRKIQDELSALGRKINDSIGPESAFSRRMAEFDERVLDGVRWAADSVSAAVSRHRDGAKPGDGLDPSEPPSPADPKS